MNDKKRETRGLGRGLSALMADLDDARSPVPGPNGASDLRLLPVERVQPNPDQPRKTFHEGEMQELAESIRAKGVIQPIVVRPLSGGEFQIVAGERRWRAAQMARIHEIPAIIREYSDRDMVEIAIIENIQRADLDPLEEASAYQRLIDVHGYSQDEVAQSLGKSRSHVSNMLRLLGLPPEVMSLLVQGQISAGHARALLTSSDPLSLARKVIADGLSVRQTEALARENKGDKKPYSARNAARRDADTIVLEQDLSANLGMAVIIDHRADGTGRMVIRYETLEDLDRLCQVLSTSR
jgi:ParB family chromosome partitioning protein